jgi:hypothetical protein
MRGKRTARARGSRAPRILGAGVAVLLAGAGVAAYLLVARSHKDGAALPTRVLSTQAIRLVSQQPQATGSGGQQTLLAARAGLAFTPAAQLGADWTADQMAGGTYVFIYLPSGLCLGSPMSVAASALTLATCNLQASQRWERVHPVVGGTGLDYWQLRNLANRRCLTAEAASAASPARFPARLEPCQASPDWRQLIAFLIAS